jgi:peptidoglycan/LPS O-acetylase OafA/YrhL
MNKLKYITILRGLASLSVIVGHIAFLGTGINLIHPFITSIFYNSARGVQLFFILSAFTLFMSFNMRKVKESNPIFNYFIRRFFRIAPLFYLAIIYYLWQDGTGPRNMLGDAKTITSSNIISNFLFMHGVSPYWIDSLVSVGWTVSIEVMFYCLLPFLFYRIKNIQQACAFTLVTLCLRMLLLFILSQHVPIGDKRLWSDFLFYYLPNQLPIFGLGIILYFLIYDKKNLNFSPKFLFYSCLIIVFFLAIQPGLFIPDIFCYGIVFLVAIFSLHKYIPIILNNRIFIHLGQISYSLYLTHQGVIYFVKKYSLINLINTHNEPLAILNFFVNYFLVVILSVLISTILYHIIEEPGIKTGAKVIKIFRKKSMAASLITDSHTF